MNFVAHPLKQHRSRIRWILSLLLIAAVGFSDVRAAETAFSIGVEGQVYRDVIEPSLFPLMRLGGNHHTRRTSDETITETKIDFEFRLGLRNPKAFSFASQNLYWGDADESPTSDLRFTFGRRKITWSGLEDLWNLGNIEPLDAWDRLRPRSQGLTGVFAYSQTPVFNFRLFVSGVSFPESNPNVILENNQFQRVHPQSTTSAPQTIKIENQTTPLGYEIKIPSLNRLLIRSSFLAMMETKPEQRLLARFTYGYLPLNYYPLSMEQILNIPLDQGIVTIRPRIVDHHIYSGDLGYRINDRLSLGVSGLADDPKSETLPVSVTYNYTALTSQLMTSPWIHYQMNHAKFSLSHLWTRGGIGSDFGQTAQSTALASGQGLFSSHVFYRSATLLSAHFYPTSATEAGSFLVRYIYEHAVQSSWFSWDIYIKTPKQGNQGWSGVIGGDVIQAGDPKNKSRGAEFLSDIRAFDRVRMGIQYAF
jgi:hypothetical protein